MKKLLAALLIIFSIQSAVSQILPTSVVSTLSTQLSETSGLIIFDGKIITHNDSSGEPRLYEIDTTNGSVSRSVLITNASNIDWEDITQDSTYIYIADIGNNNGTRIDLRIYRISKADYLQMDSIVADTINYLYSDQAKVSSNYDAETLIAFGDSLYIFSKNWTDFHTRVYAVPKEPGNYSVNTYENFNVQGLVTGGTYNPASGEILLTAYYTSTFVIKLSQFHSNRFFNGNVVWRTLQLSGPTQVEAICPMDSSHYLISSESVSSLDATLYQFDLHYGTAIEENQMNHLRSYPNPATSFIMIDFPENSHLRLYDAQGKFILKSKDHKISLEDLNEGLYLYRIISNQRHIYTGKFIKL